MGLLEIHRQIVDLWRGKYSQVLHPVEDDKDRHACMAKLNECVSQAFDVVTIDELRVIVKNSSSTVNNEKE